MSKTESILTTTALALTANMFFSNSVHDGTMDLENWNLSIKNPVVLDSIPALPTIIGDRRAVSPFEAEFNSVGRILFNGNNHCSGNVVTIDGYQPRGEGFLVSTAAHCVDQSANSQNLTFAVNFINEDGALEYAHFGSPLIWYNPAYNSEARADVPHDQALMFFPNQSLPEEVTPANLQIFSAHIMRDFGVYEWQGLSHIISAGYSKDMDGLSADKDCRIIEFRSADNPYLKTDCSLSYGASGSGLIIEGENGEQIIGAITSARRSDVDVTDDTFYSNYTLMYHKNLSTIPFLEKDETCARVTAPSGLRVRTENYSAPNSAYTTLPFNEVVFATDMLEDEQEKYGSEDVWIEIRTLDNPDAQTPNGYSNSAWLESAPCPAR